MKHNILYILLGFSALLTSCVQEEIENLGKIQSAIESVILFPDASILKIESNAIKHDGKVYVQGAYAWPFNEDFYDSNIGNTVFYPDNYDVGLVAIGGHSDWMLQPNKTYKVKLFCSLIPKDATPNEFDFYWSDESDIMDCEFEYEVPDYTFTTPETLADAVDAHGNNIFEVKCNLLENMPTSALFEVGVSMNQSSKLSYFYYIYGEQVCSDDYPGRLAVLCYSDPELKNLVDSGNNDDGLVSLKNLQPDEDYYAVVVSNDLYIGHLYLAYDYEQYGTDLSFEFKSGTPFSKPFKFHTPKDLNEALGVDTDNLFDVSYDLIYSTPTSALIDATLFVQPDSDLKFGYYEWGDNQYEEFTEYGGLRILCYSDPQLTKLVDSVNQDYHNGIPEYPLTRLEPNTEYYCIAENYESFEMYYRPKEYGRKYSFDFDEGMRFDKTVFKFKTPKDINEAFGLFAKYEIQSLSPNSAIIEAGLCTSNDSDWTFSLDIHECVCYLDLIAFKDPQLTELVGAVPLDCHPTIILDDLDADSDYYCILQNSDDLDLYYKWNDYGYTYFYRIPDNTKFDHPVFKFHTPKE